MGVTYIEGEVAGTRGKTRKVRFLVDSGATYPLLPKSVWESLGLKAQAPPDVLVGAMALEILGLVLNPFDRNLYPMRMLMC